MAFDPADIFAKRVVVRVGGNGRGMAYGLW